MNKHTTYRGRIRYWHDRLGETGREWFNISRLPEGERIVRSICEMDDIGLLRDVTLTVGPDFSPRHCYNRLTLHDRFAGAAWFVFNGPDIACETIDAAGEIARQQVALSRPTPVFACHPLYVDGYHAAAFDHAKPERLQVFDDCTNSSMRLDGSTRPTVGVVRKAVEYVGPEDITVPAGHFRADHYRIHPLRIDEPEWNDNPLDFWVHGPELLFLKLRWDMIESTYELIELDAPNDIAMPSDLRPAAA
jgi:hypothetical protein